MTGSSNSCAGGAKPLNPISVRNLSISPMLLACPAPAPKPDDVPSDVAVLAGGYVLFWSPVGLARYPPTSKDAPDAAA